LENSNRFGLQHFDLPCITMILITFPGRRDHEYTHGARLIWLIRKGAFEIHPTREKHDTLTMESSFLS